MRCHHLLQHVLGNDAGFAPQYLAVTKEDHGGYALNVVGACSVRIAVNVDLKYAYLVAHFLGELLDDWSHHLAGTAPIRVKVDKHRFVALDYVAESFSPICTHIVCNYVPEGTAASVRRNRLLDRMPL